MLRSYGILLAQGVRRISQGQKLVRAEPSLPSSSAWSLGIYQVTMVDANDELV